MSETAEPSSDRLWTRLHERPPGLSDSSPLLLVTDDTSECRRAIFRRNVLAGFLGHCSTKPPSIRPLPFLVTHATTTNDLLFASLEAVVPDSGRSRSCATTFHLTEGGIATQDFLFVAPWLDYDRHGRWELHELRSEGSPHYDVLEGVIPGGPAIVASRDGNGVRGRALVWVSRESRGVTKFRDIREIPLEMGLTVIPVPGSGGTRHGVLRMGRVHEWDPGTERFDSVGVSIGKAGWESLRMPKFWYDKESNPREAVVWRGRPFWLREGRLFELVVGTGGEFEVVTHLMFCRPEITGIFPCGRHGLLVSFSKPQEGLSSAVFLDPESLTLLDPEIPHDGSSCALCCNGTVALWAGSYPEGQPLTFLEPSKLASFAKRAVSEFFDSADLDRDVSFSCYVAARGSDRALTQPPPEKATLWKTRGGKLHQVIQGLENCFRVAAGIRCRETPVVRDLLLPCYRELESAGDLADFLGAPIFWQFTESQGHGTATQRGAVVDVIGCRRSAGEVLVASWVGSGLQSHHVSAENVTWLAVLAYAKKDAEKCLRDGPVKFATKEQLLAFYKSASLLGLDRTEGCFTVESGQAVVVDDYQDAESVQDGSKGVRLPASKGKWFYATRGYEQTMVYHESQSSKALDWSVPPDLSAAYAHPMGGWYEVQREVGKFGSLFFGDFHHFGDNEVVPDHLAGKTVVGWDRLTFKGDVLDGEDPWHLMVGTLWLDDVGAYLVPHGVVSNVLRCHRERHVLAYKGPSGKVDALRIICLQEVVAEPVTERPPKKKARRALLHFTEVKDQT